MTGQSGSRERSNTWKIVNRIILGLLIVLCILSITGLLNFGHGLGNIVYFPPIILAAVAHLYITRRLNRNKDNDYWLPLIIVASIICFAIIYKVTIGRGPEFPWNGEMFFIK